MTKEDIRQYQRDNPVYYPAVTTLRTKCPVNYDCDDCSSKEYGMRCRTCANYNPLRMLYELHKEKKTRLLCEDDVIKAVDKHTNMVF